MKSVVNIITVDGHYEIYVNNEFRVSCDEGELSKTINELEELNEI